MLAFLAEPPFQPALPLLAFVRPAFLTLHWHRSIAIHRRPPVRSLQLHRNWGSDLSRRGTMTGRRRWSTVALVWAPVDVPVPVALTVAGLTVGRGALVKFFQNWTLKMGSPSKAVEAINLSQIWLVNMWNSVHRTVLAAGIRRVAPLICSLTICSRS